MNGIFVKMTMNARKDLESANLMKLLQVVSLIKSESIKTIHSQKLKIAVRRIKCAS